ncbi:CLAVATA3/ESR (CLE)-related protein 25-like protein [Carex littledalei]|uniref:CLAVATA3/ESR (CLE)-related protein 25-like protein n=1 Tax=Carex littledalei TaxID=544730 RepID=A0A833VDX1_9POAL|nr:CLAVATA3/ESR (CLE)-related protein 25-like protein [Carex littledalei]
MSCLGSMARRMVCLVCVGFFVAHALLQGGTNVEKQGANTVASYSSSNSSPPPLPLQNNFQVPKLKGRTMGPKKLDTFRDIKRKVPNGPDPIHNSLRGAETVRLSPYIRHSNGEHKAVHTHTHTHTYIIERKDTYPYIANCKVYIKIKGATSVTISLTWPRRAGKSGQPPGRQ